jgi:diguanylate cyclase (GGDEF)-like protein
MEEMKEKIDYLLTYPKVPVSAKKSFTMLYRQADALMLGLLSLQWFIATFITSLRYDTYLYGFFGGALIVVPLMVLYPHLKGDKFYRYFVSISMMLFSLIFIQQHLGRIEMHFHIFIAMAILILYNDINTILIATITTLLHHLVFNYLQFYEVVLFDMPVMVFNYGCGLDIVLLHGLFVISEFFILGYIIKLRREHSIDLNIANDKVSELNEELKYSSLHDSLTGLPNRLYLQEQIEGVKKHSQLVDKKFAVVFLDLDHFKNINDTLGHDVGDALLQTVANILKNNVGQNDLISRIGGDEFIIVVSDFEKTEELLPMINGILNEFRKEMLIKGYSMRLSSSIGISLYPDDATSVRELMKYADIAMYNAKEEGRDNFCFFTNTLNTRIHDEVDIVNDMQRALYDNEFKLFYQPKVDAKTKKIVGAEALLRWVHSEKGMISPGIFVPLAENTGFMLSLGKFVIQESIAAIDRFNKLGYDDLKISINVSTRQFQNTDIYKDIKDELEKNSVRATSLSIEITEGIMIQQISKTINTLNDIRDLGVSIYIDDFGTGYSSLSYLDKFPVDVLKIDKSFVDTIDEKQKEQSPIINTIIAMGKGMNMKVIAEGVEDYYQYNYLKDKGCDMIQGYYFAKPMCEDEFIEFVSKGIK